MMSTGGAHETLELGVISPEPIPTEGLVAYVEYDGPDAQADAWKGTAAHAILAETPSGETLTSISRQAIDRFHDKLFEAIGRDGHAA